MFNLALLRENPDVVRKNLKKRRAEDKLMLVDEAVQLDVRWRELKGEVDALRHRRNGISQEINAAKKQGKDVRSLIAEVKSLPARIEKQETELCSLKDRLEEILGSLPNMLHDSVPVGESDADNVVVKKFGKLPKFSFAPQSHVDVMEKWGLVDLERAAKISGARWYFLKKELAVLELALSRYAVDFMRKKGFELVLPPLMMQRRPMRGVVPLGDFEEALYKVEGEDLFAIATSEQPMTALLMDEVVEESALPKKFVAYSACFRKEAGAHGKDTKGIFRVHQFNKVEQIVFASPEQSWKLHEELLKNAVEFFSSLGVHGRVVNVCTGDIGMVAAKKYDVEVWMPVQKAYREVVSCSNCTEYQALGLNIRYQQGSERPYVHTLNSTCVATTRALVAIMENFQDKNGVITVPKVLQKYCGFKKIGEVKKTKRRR